MFALSLGDCCTSASDKNGTADEPRTRTKYAYDGLARLYTAATTGSAAYPAWGLQETYDRYGNRWSQTAISGCTGITCPQPSVSVNLATNHLIGPPYAYDLNGSMTNDGLNTQIVYDAENHATSGSGSLGSGTYTYDGNGLRVKKVSGSTTTVYIFSGSKVIAEYDNGAAVSSPSREYIYGGAALLAKVDSSGTKYYHQDHLSNRLVTDSSGNTLAQMGHFPFGESWYNSTSDKLLFTSYERDAESSNDYAQARYYVNRLGRFLSLDPLSGSTSDPQTLDRYTYVRNSPGANIDPTGKMMCASVPCQPGAWAGIGEDGGMVPPPDPWQPGITACGIDTFCVQNYENGVLGPFDSPVAQIHCYDDGSGCQVGSYDFSHQNIGGTWTVDWEAQRQAEIDAAIKDINRAFKLIAKNMPNTDPNAQVPVVVQYKYGVWVVQLSDCGTSCSVDSNQANASGWADPLTIFHQGNPSWYFGSLFGFDTGHLVGGDPANAHIDPYGPFNPFHYLLQLPAMLFPPGPAGYTTCSVNAGCQ